MDQRDTGASSRSVSLVRSARSRERQRLLPGVPQPIGQTIVGRTDQVVGDDQIQDDGGDDIEHHDDECGDCTDAYGMASVTLTRFHVSTIRYPMPRTVSMRALLPPNLARSRPTWTSMVFDPTASASSSQTWVAMTRRVKTVG